MSTTRTFRIWCGIKARCHIPSATGYAGYGGRGITVCDRWRFGENGLSAFECFLADMGMCPPGHSIERRDGKKGYGPGNCYWATAKVQSTNRSNTLWLNYQGERVSLAEAARRSGMKRTTLKQRYVLGWRGDDLFLPPGTKPAAARTTHPF